MNQLLENRMNGLRTSLDALAAGLDDNLQILLLNLTCDTVTAKTAPVAVEPLARTVREACLSFMTREHPMAHDLKFAMAILLVGQDYERMQAITATFNRRVEFLRGTRFQDICKDMTGVVADILNMNAMVQETWQRNAHSSIPVLQAQVASLLERIQASIAMVQHKILGSIALANGNAEAYVELVLACRHLKRVAHLMANIPNEMTTFSLIQVRQSA